MSAEPSVPTGNGDCGEVALEMMLVLPGSEVCHGRPLGRGGQAKGHRYFHAWVEKDGIVFDFSNGLRVAMPVVRYYAIGNINPKRVRRYSQDEAARMVFTYRHCGPWDGSFPPLPEFEDEEEENA